MSDIVERLAVEQEVEVRARPEPIKAFREALERGYVHILFPGTRGGTELGVRLDPEQSDLSRADLEAGTGSVLVIGNLMLDYVPVRLHARIELPELKGTGRLERLETMH